MVYDHYMVTIIGFIGLCGSYTIYSHEVVILFVPCIVLLMTEVLEVYYHIYISNIMGQIIWGQS